MASAGTSDPARLAVDMMAHDKNHLQTILDKGEAGAIAALHIRHCLPWYRACFAEVWFGNYTLIVYLWSK